MKTTRDACGSRWRERKKAEDVVNEAVSVGCTDEQTIVILSRGRTVEMEKTTLEALQERWSAHKAYRETHRAARCRAHSTLDHYFPTLKLVSVQKPESASSHVGRFFLCLL